MHIEVHFNHYLLLYEHSARKCASIRFLIEMVLRVSALGALLRLVILLPWSLFVEGVWRGGAVQTCSS